MLKLFGRKKAEKKTNSSKWVTTSDGVPQKLVDDQVKFFLGEHDGIYEIECDTGKGHGIIFGPNKDDTLMVVQNVVKNSNNSNVFLHCKKGDILVCINSRPIMDNEPEDIRDLLEMIELSSNKLRMKIINPNKISLQSFLESLIRQSKKHKDLYGFTRSSDFVMIEKLIQSTQNKLNAARDIEWVEYLKSIGGPDNLKPGSIFKPSTDLKYICRRGIPPAMRNLVWQRISLSNIYRQTFPLDWYESLLKRCEKELPYRVKSDIDKDVDRTFPEHDYFGARSVGLGEGCASMRRVLEAFAIHNPSVGYCQSLNFIVATLLLFLNEVDSFWLLATIVEQLLPHDYYTTTMIGVYVDQCVLGRILQKRLPRLHSFFEKHQVQLPLVSLQWFLCLFVNTLSVETSLRVWDVFLNEGNKVLFKASLALFQIHENRLLSSKDSSELFNNLKVIGQDLGMINPDVLLHKMYGKTSENVKAFIYRQKRKLYLNPRLPRSSSDGNAIGGVPQRLIGIGLAHMGPKDASIRSQSAKETSTSTSALENNQFSSSNKENVSTKVKTTENIPSSAEVVGINVDEKEKSEKKTTEMKEIGLNSDDDDSDDDRNTLIIQDISVVIESLDIKEKKARVSKRISKQEKDKESGSISKKNIVPTDDDAKKKDDFVEEDANDDNSGSGDAVDLSESEIDSDGDNDSGFEQIPLDEDISTSRGLRGSISLTPDEMSKAFADPASSSSSLPSSSLASSSLLLGSSARATSSRTNSARADFNRSDLLRWREEFRPEVERAFLEMERARRSFVDQSRRVTDKDDVNGDNGNNIDEARRGGGASSSVAGRSSGSFVSFANFLSSAASEANETDNKKDKRLEKEVSASSVRSASEERFHSLTPPRKILTSPPLSPSTRSSQEKLMHAEPRRRSDDSPHSPVSVRSAEIDSGAVTNVANSPVSVSPIDLDITIQQLHRQSAIMKEVQDDEVVDF